ncbi:hypothetical protein N665_0037s0006 [Sinapis alba]|nr:hypothetical protein N665_0037s0006 [Sinapis alba]
MDSLEPPKRIFTLEEEPFPIKNIAYYTDDSKLFSTVRDALHDDEYKELKESKSGVFLKFKEMDFGWASRLVHYLLCFQLNIKKNYELWSLVGADPVRFSLIEFEQLTGLNCEYIENLENPICEVTNEMASFWERIGVSVDAGPSLEQIIRVCRRCQEWSQDDRMRLGYLAIFSGFIEGRKYSNATRASLARFVMDLEKFKNYPWGRVSFKVLMDSWRAKDFTKSYTVDGFIHVLQIRVINYVEKDIEEIFPKWDNDREDVAVENIIQDLTDVMIDGFRMCLKEMKFLGNRMNVVEKMMGITGKGTSSDDFQQTTSTKEAKAKEAKEKEAKEKEAKEKGAKEKETKEKEEKEAKLVAEAWLVEAKQEEEAKAVEASVVLMDKDKDTVSEVKMHEARRLSKKDSALQLSEKGVNERGSLLPHSNLLLGE